MSHKRPSKKRGSEAAHAEDSARTFRSWLLRRETLILVAIAAVVAIPFGYGKYFEFNSPGAFDSGAYVHSAAHIVAGAEIGVDEKPSAQLGTLLVNMVGVWMFGYSETGPLVMQTLLQALALVLMFVAMRRAFGLAPAALGVLIAAVYLSCPLLAKFGNVKEQFMIAFMIIGVSCFVLYQCGGRWGWALLAGAFIAWAPLFKPTGLSSVGAVGLFVLLQPILGHRSWRQTAKDIGFLVAGVGVGIAPLYIWILGGNVQISLPYAFLWKILIKPFVSSAPEAGQATAGYVSTSRHLIPFSEQWPRVLRYYAIVILPIALAIGAIVLRVVRWAWPRFAKRPVQTQDHERLVLLLATWWVLDMAFVWISPRSYEQYYLPLNASAAMLSGYLTAFYLSGWRASLYKVRWVFAGLVAVILMVIMSWHIFFGITKRPHSGGPYLDRSGKVVRQRGYVQKQREIARRRQPGAGRGAWEALAAHIRDNSNVEDRIYVWGWFPGIYVYAERFSAASTACTITRIAPNKLDRLVQTMLTEFKTRPPKFIVDSRKRHLPIERPPYELWPVVLKGFMGAEQSHLLPPTPEAVQAYEAEWSNELRKKFGEDEARRFEILSPLRAYVRTHYRVVNVYGGQILFEVKRSDAGKDPPSS